MTLEISTLESRGSPYGALVVVAMLLAATVGTAHPLAAGIKVQAIRTELSRKVKTFVLH